MQIVKVSNSRTSAAFHDIHKKLSDEHQFWIPHLKQDIEKIFNPKKNALLKKGQAQRWILKKNGDVKGRIAAFINPKTKNSFEQPTGGVGFFDCINDQSCADILFNTAKNWLELQGIEAMDGSINFGEKNQYWGILVENYNYEPTYGMNYNPPYYKELFENYGFELYYDQLVYKRNIFMPMQEVFLSKFERIKRMPGVHLQTAKGKSIEQLAEAFVTVYNDAWSAHEGLKGMKKASAIKLFKTLKPIMDRNIVYFVYENERPIAFFLNVPDLNYYFKKFNGNFHLLNKIRFLIMQKMKSPEKMIGVIFGVVKQYQGKGMEGAMIVWAHEILKKTNYKDIVMTWIGDFNPRMLRVVENLGSELYQRYTTYRFLFDSEKPFKRAPIIGAKRKNNSET